MYGSCVDKAGCLGKRKRKEDIVASHAFNNTWNDALMLIALHWDWKLLVLVVSCNINGDALPILLINPHA